MDVKWQSAEFAFGTGSRNTAALNRSGKATEIKTIAENYETDLNNENNGLQLISDDFKIMTQEMNKFMQLLDADLKFVLHEGTKQLMVQVVDTREQKVLKEFPPHELLDTMAKIRDYVGLLLDKKV
ncbi:MAG TPA: flagellar protein FlaG [Desulfitobacteriaceae bacterium]|nr:flagellar protein FlaG [Desulfitobacteriaceae bacterium]